MKESVNVWEEDILLPTYGIGRPEKNPMFLEKRVYQGSSGVVYPYPVIEKIEDTCEEKSYHAVWLENEYIKVTECKSGCSFLTEHPFPFAYPYNDTSVFTSFDAVVHRQEGAGTVMLRPVELNASGDPGTGESYQCRLYYVIVIDKMPLLYLVECHLNTSSQFGQDHDFDVFVLQPYGMITFLFAGIFNFLVWVSERERMFGQKGTAGFTLRPGRAVLEIQGKVSNPTPLPQTFLWWANPAVAVNDML